MTALIKTIIAAIIGTFGSLEMDQTPPMELTVLKAEKKCSSSVYFTPETNCKNNVISWECLNSSSAS